MADSLRNRIATLYVVATGVFILVLFVLLYQVVSRTVYTHLDEDLTAESNEVHNNLIVLSDQFAIANPFEWQEREHAQAEVNPTFIQIIDTNGALVTKSGNLRDNALPFDRTITGTRHADAQLAGAPIRLMQLPILSPHGRTLGFLLIAMPRQEADVVLRNLRTTLFLSYPLVMIAIFAVSRFIAGRSIAPVNSVITTAEHITQKNLDVRIPLPPGKDELYRLATTVNALLDRLRDAVLREQQFTADAAHELLTPLAALRGTLEVTIRKPRSLEYYVEKIANCIEEVNRISNLVDQLLLIARADSGTLKPSITSIDLPRALHTVLDRLEPLLVDRALRADVHAASGVFVRADQTMLDRILENILSNAIKYSRTGESIEIVVGSDVPPVTLSVIDHGTGMTEEQRSRVFDRFYRADASRSSRVPGAGLGLAIAKRLADIQHLSLSVRGGADGGTVFTVAFP